MKGHVGRRLALVGLAVVTAVTGVLPGVMEAQADTVAEVVQVVDPSTWSPIAPGPAGVAYRPVNNSLIVVDSDRNNLNPFDGINLWEYSLTTGLVLYTGILPTEEPTGVDYDPIGNRLFVSSDSDDIVLVIGPGGDGKFGTGDDVDLGEVALVGDIEDPAFHPNGHLYVLNGNQSLVFDIDPGLNEIFGDLDDIVLAFGIPPDLSATLPDDWEGLAYDPVSGNLIAGAKDDEVIHEFTTDGDFVQKHELDSLNPFVSSLSGLGAQPGAGSIPTTYWIADRGSSQTATIDDGGLLRVTFGPAPQLPPEAQNQTVNTNVGAAKAITLMATDINNDSLTYTVVTQPTKGSLTGTGASRTYTPAAGFSGVDSFTFRAHDGTAFSNVATVTVNVVNRAPTVLNPGNLGPHGEGDVVSVAMHATDPDPSGTPPGTLTWSATGLPTGLGISPTTGVIAGTVSLGATSGSPYNVTVKATDAGTPPRSHQVSFTWTIVNTNRSPILAAIGSKTVTQGSLLAFKASASDPDGDGLTFSLVNPPAGAAITSAGNFTWTPNVSPGNYQVTVKVTDNGTPVLTDQETFTVTVQAANANPDPSNRFVDDNGHIFEKAIEWLAAKGITQGCNPPVNDRFCPNDWITRGQMAAFLVRAFSYTDNGGGNLFRDDDGHIFENAIDKLATAGVTLGCNPPANNRFCPDDLVTRGQMAAFLGRAFNYTDNGGGDLFRDDDGSVFENAIDRLRTAGVTQGCNPPANDRYCPNDFVTRGQMAAFLKRAFGE